MSPASKYIKVEIKGDTRELRRQFIKAELVMTRSFWRWVRLRYELWKVNREPVP